MSVGTNIKKRRYELRMSQQELANAMGYKTRSTIAKIESGENDVSQKKLRRFAEVLDTSVESLISGYGSTYNNTIVYPSVSDSAQRANKNVLIILAGGKTGKNSRNIPNQFIAVHGKPIIVHCLDAYQNHPLIDDIYIVCLKGWEAIVSAYAKEFNITKLKGLVPAGNSGINSLRGAFKQIRANYSENDTVIVQESTRPMITTETISKLLLACDEKGSATICHYMRDYVQFDVSGGYPEYIDREKIIAVQSPEAHRVALLDEVFSVAEENNHPFSESCCTMLMYNLGYDINFIEGDINNIKVEREEDIVRFSALSKSKNI
jgi:2-C-methyl-D-erythritol 4-phosphate cytidylyltransferase